MPGTATRDTGTARSALTNATFVERNKFVTPSDPKLRQDIGRLIEYLNQRGIEAVFKEFSATILSRNELPYNPYPAFVRRMRVSSEKFHMGSKTDEEVKQHLACQYEQTHIAHVVRAGGVWALSSIARVLHPASLQRYDWLLNDLVPRDLQETRGYTNQALVALVGPAVFSGGVYEHVQHVTVRLEHVVTGPLLKTGVRMFVNDIISDILNMDKGNHRCLVVRLETRLGPDSDAWKTRVWEADMITAHKNDFARSLSDAIVANKLITVECLFCLSPQTKEYVRGQKQYSLNFVKVAKDATEQEELHFFSDFALSTLHEGVFLNQAHAEGYLALFTSRLELIDQAATTSTADAGSSKSTFGAPRRAGARPQRDDYKSVGGGVATGPYAWQITAPLKSEWQGRVAALDPAADIYEIAHYLLLLALIESDSLDWELVHEVYRLQRSTGAQLHGLVIACKTLKELAFKHKGNVHDEIVQSMYAKFTEDVKECFLSQMHERSQDMVVHGRVVTEKIDHVLSLQDHVTQLSALQREMMESLKNLESYMTGILLHLSEDALFWCANIKSTIQTLQSAHVNKIQRPTTAVRDPAKGKTGVKPGQLPTTYKHGVENEVILNHDRNMTGVKPGQLPTTYKHGVENEVIMNHDRNMVSVELGMQRDNAPQVVAKESVLLKYVLDTHLDDVWTCYIMSLVAASNYPPNPYPRFVTQLRQAAIKMDLCFEATSKTTQDLLHGAVRCVDEANHVYTLPGCPAHGDDAVMSVLDSGAWTSVVKVVQPLINTTVPQQRGAYKIAVCGAIQGGACFYGKLDPYLSAVELHEHCFIRGPTGCEGEAIQLYTKIIFQDVYKKFRAAEVLVTGAFLGHEQVRWGIGELFMERKQGFVYECERLVLNREPVVFKMYVQMEWGYIPVYKHYQLHYIDADESQFQEFYPTNAAHYYRNIFFDKDKAAFFYQYGSPLRSRDPHSSMQLAAATQQLDDQVLAAEQRADWLQLYRQLLLRTFLKKGTAVVAEAWRMMHCMGRQVDYVIGLGRDLREIVLYQLDRRKMGIDGTRAPAGGSDVLVDPVEAVLSQMVTAFKQKLEHVTQASKAIVPRAYRSVLADKMSKITERDKTTKELFLIIAPPTRMTLDEICQYLAPVRDALLYDTHSINFETHALLASLRAQDSNASPRDSARPLSAASSVLTQYSDIQDMPSAIVQDYADMWST